MNHIHKLINIHIGKRVTLRRAELQLMLESLSIISGIPLQDLLRIEAGKTQVTAVQIFYLACALHVPTNYFFEKHDEEITTEIHNLISAFSGITSPTTRASIIRYSEDNASISN